MQEIHYIVKSKASAFLFNSHKPLMLYVYDLYADDLYAYNLETVCDAE
jgi:hypothetical protein